MQRVPDPYTVLGVPRSATLAQVKVAHRALAKRFHPDAPEGDTGRFLAIQSAYQLLSDPVSRRRWDAEHAPGPFRATTHATRPRTATGQWTGDDAGPGSARPRPGARRPGGAAATGATMPEREPTSRTHTWSAKGVPWWEDSPAARRAAERRAERDAGQRSGGASAGPEPPASGEPAPPRGGAEPRSTSGPRPDPSMDVYTRSSGAAWSSAARRYFRRSDQDLPSRGTWRMEGTQVVTGARARQAAEAEGARQRGPAGTSPDSGARPTRSTGSPVAPSEADSPSEATPRDPTATPRDPTATPRDPTATPRDPTATPPHRRAEPTTRQAVPPTQPSAARPGPSADRPRAPGPSATPPSAQASSATRWTTAGSHPRQDGPRAATPALSSDLGRYAVRVAVASVAPVVLVTVALPAATGCAAPGAACGVALPVAQTLVAVSAILLLAAFPLLARVAAWAGVAAAVVGLALVMIAVLVGLTPPARPIVEGAVAVVVTSYVVAAAVAATLIGRRSRGSPVP